MQDFLSTIGSSLAKGQKNLLQAYLQDAAAGRVAADPDAIQAALAQAGTLLPDPDADVTIPDGFNAALSTLLANIAGLYQEIDRVESAQSRLADLNDAELNRTAVALQDLGTVLDATRRAHAENTQWTDVFHESFGAAVLRETGPEWYQALPALFASGQVAGFLPLAIDPEDHALKLLTGGEFTRTTNALGQPLVAVEVDEVLGLSIDPNHAIDQAVDGKLSTFWRELVLSDSPIDADPAVVPWLTDDYTGGTAARVRFRFPFAVPFTELVLRPFSRYPVQVLQVVWDNRRQPAVNFVRNGDFASGATAWATGGTDGTTFAFQADGGWQGHPSVVVAALSGRALLENATFGFAETRPAVHLHFLLYRRESIVPQVFVNWYASGGALLFTEWVPPDTPFGEWYEYSRLFLAPAGAVSGSLTLAADGSGEIRFSDVAFARAAGQNDTLQTVPAGADALTVELDNVTGTDVWVLLAQPHYDYAQLAIPAGELDQQALWQEIRLQAEATDEQLFQFQPTAWNLAGGSTGDPLAALPVDGSTLFSEARRLGGRLKELVLALLTFAQPSDRTVTLSRYLYTLGAWELALRHHEYAGQGLFVTQPYHPRGEVREVTLQTDPPLAELLRTRFWMTARAADKSDKAQLFNGRATFSSAIETPQATADCHFTLPPVSRRERFASTDRSGRVPLAFQPYVNRERLWALQNDLSSGAIAAPLRFDPNRTLYLVDSAGALRNVAGYVPLQVTLTFSDGTVASPDTLGKVQAGDISFVGPEILTSADATQDHVTQSSSDSGTARTTFPGLVAKKQKQKKQTVTYRALQTRFSGIVTGVNGVTFSLYWHNPVFDAASGFTVTRADVLVPPGKYTVDAERGIVILRDTPPSGNTAYTQFVAYYYYRQDELGARASSDNRAAESRPTSGIDFGGGLSQQLPVTRNVTDYVHGTTPKLTPAVLDDLAPDYYPFFEYLVDDRGRLVFANILADFGDQSAEIQVDYLTLLIEPRLLIEYAAGSLNELSTKTPVLRSFALFMNSRR